MMINGEKLLSWLLATRYMIRAMNCLVACWPVQMQNRGMGM